MIKSFTNMNFVTHQFFFSKKFHSHSLWQMKKKKVHIKGSYPVLFFFFFSFLICVSNSFIWLKFNSYLNTHKPKSVSIVFQQWTVWKYLSLEIWKLPEFHLEMKSCNRHRWITVPLTNPLHFFWSNPSQPSIKHIPPNPYLWSISLHVYSPRVSPILDV